MKSKMQTELWRYVPCAGKITDEIKDADRTLEICAMCWKNNSETKVRTVFKSLIIVN
jgi:hypothetical protein